MSFFNKKIFNFSQPAFGLDLSDLSVKVVQLERKSDYDCICAFGSVPLTSGSVIDGEVMRQDQVIEAIKKVVSSAGPRKIKNKKVICSLPETKAFLRLISIPEMQQEEAKEAIKWEMEANIPLPIDQVYYDWQILEKKISKDSSKMDVLVVAVACKVIDQFMEIMKSVGLEVCGLEIESIAQARAFLGEEEEKQKISTLIMDIGDRRTSFSISVGNATCFTTSVPLSSQSMIDSISKGLAISPEEAEKIKKEKGIGSVIQNDPLFQALKPTLENLASELEKSIDFYLSGLGYSDSVDKIIVCGGGANTKGIIPYLAQKISRPVEIGNPWKNIKIGKNLPIIEKDKSVQYSTAIGLALKGLYYEDLS